jgi:hypothetical protein
MSRIIQFDFWGEESPDIEAELERTAIRFLRSQEYVTTAQITADCSRRGIQLPSKTHQGPLPDLAKKGMCVVVDAQRDPRSSRNSGAQWRWKSLIYRPVGGRG